MLVLASRLCRSFRRSVEAAGGRYVYIPTGRAQEREAPTDMAANGMVHGFSFGSTPVRSAPAASDASSGVILTAECPVVAYRQGAADLWRVRCSVRSERCEV